MGLLQIVLIVINNDNCKLANKLRQDKCEVAQLNLIPFAQAVGLLRDKWQTIDACAIGTSEVGDIDHAILIVDSRMNPRDTVTFTAIMREFKHQVVGSFFIVRPTDEEGARHAGDPRRRCGRRHRATSGARRRVV